MSELRRWALVLTYTGFFVAPTGVAPIRAAPTSAAETVIAPVALLTAVSDERGVVMAADNDGSSFPVFRLAASSPLTERATGLLSSGFAHHVIVLDHLARRFVLAQSETDAPSASAPADAGEPTYLLLSQEDGGFSRSGFWLEDETGARRLHRAGYVDLVVDEESLDDGSFEEIFSHELGHQILRELIGELPPGAGRTMHQSMALTDRSTAFDEGFAEHFQPRFRDQTTNSMVRDEMSGASGADLRRMWISRIDQQLRTDGVKQNLFIHRKALPRRALDPDVDRYQLLVDDQTSTAFVDDELRNGQQMMASEGVIATLFYRFASSTELRESYRDTEFYRPFLGPLAGDPRTLVTPEENVDLKLLAALHRSQPAIQSGTAPMIALVEAYGHLFPDEAKTIVRLFLSTTRGASTSRALASAFEEAATAGRRGNVAAYPSAAKAAFALLDATVERVTTGELELDAALGPELWLLVDDFSIAPALWIDERTVALTLDLNTASEAELLAIPGIDLATASRIVEARRARGFFAAVEELESSVTPALLARLRSMREEMAKTAALARP